jgi:uncharacterized membrane protein
MEALSDGVFSVALTLLLLEIYPANANAVIATISWWEQIFHNSGLFAASFFLVGIYWVAHKNECRYFTAADRFVDWLNLVFLATVALLPFSVRVLAESRWYILAATPKAMAEDPGAMAKAVDLYLSNVASAGLALSFLFGYIVLKGWVNAKGRENRNFTVLKNALLPLLCFIAWLCFERSPEFVLSHFLWFMAFPPSAYLVFTLCVAAFYAMRRRNHAGRGSDS